MVTSPIVVEAIGLPAPQGSKRHVGRGIMVESSKRVRPWREAVKQATLDVLATGPADDQGAAERIGFPFDRDPLEVVVTFRLPRPASHYRSGAKAHLLRDNAPTWPAGRPDVDKLQRSTLDALGEAGLWRDDSQVVRVTATKTYTDHTRPAGAVIEVWPMNARPVGAGAAHEEPPVDAGTREGELA
jgi:hypothetical protein